MAIDSHSAVGAEWHKEANRLTPRLLLFGLLLILSHVLEITPSNIDVGGIRIAVKDVIVVQGGIALVFCYFLWSQIGAYISGYNLLPLNANKRLLRSLIRTARKPYRNEKTKRMSFRTPKQAKRRAWWTMVAYNSFVLPFGLVMASIILLGLYFAIPDIWSLGEYLWDKSIELPV
jgi:hypothetical protein